MIEIYDNYSQCDELEINPNKLNCVFMSFYSHIHIKTRHSTKKELVPVVLMQMRSDGFIGFPGGKVELKDHNETLDENGLKTALLRELKEEINLEIDICPEKIIHLSTFVSDSLNVHNFSYELNEETFLKLFAHANSGLNISENTGCIISILKNFNNGTGFREFQKNNFKTTALAELRMLKERLSPKLI